MLVTLPALCSLLSLAVAAPLQVEVLHAVTGPQSGAHFGCDVDGGSDIDGDGIRDLLGMGEGKSGIPLRLLALSGADGGLLLDLELPEHGRGAVAGIGDVDGDGRGDLAYGTSSSNHFRILSGADGHELFTAVGPPGNAYFGAAVAAAGDVNADGVGDIIVGSGSDNLFDEGGDTMRVYSGADFALLHEISYYQPFFPFGYGWSVDGVGDVNGDGHGDVVVGEPLTTGTPWNAGGAIVYSGADFAVLYAFPGSAEGDKLGWRVAGVGDVDGDGVPDIAAGTRGEGPSGCYVRVYSGATGTQLLQLDGLGAPDTWPGLDIDAAGDLDGDGHDDVLVGRQGAAIVFSGATGVPLLQADGLPASISLQDGGFGPIVATATGLGDVNGDGALDFGIGNAFDDAGGTNAGKLLIVSGQPLTWSNAGSGLAGAFGVPRLFGSGTLQAGTPGELQLMKVPPLATSLLVAGFSAPGTPFKAGTLVPSPDLLLNLMTGPAGAGGAGSFTLPWAAWPAGLPPYTSLWLQAWTLDAAALNGASASNALHAVTP